MVAILPIQQQSLFGDSADLLPPPPPAARCQRGDIWGLGRHLLMCGDNTNAEDVRRLLDAAPAPPRLLITDPPYGIGYDSTSRAGHSTGRRTIQRLAEGKKVRGELRRQGAVVNDDRADWGEAFALCPAPIGYIWHAALHTREAMDGIERGGYETRQHIVWIKDNLALGWSAYHWQHEPCLYVVRAAQLGKGGVGWLGGQAQSTTWQIRAVQSPATEAYDRDGSEHPTQKPVECFARPMRNHSGDVVIDMFAGSGTVFIAAERIGRTALGIEIAPQYADMAIARYEGYTGRKAALIERLTTNKAPCSGCGRRAGLDANPLTGFGVCADCAALGG